MDSELPVPDPTEPSGTPTATPESPSVSPTLKSIPTSERTPSSRVDTRLKKSKVIAGLISGLTVADAAEAAGVKRSLVHNWKNRDTQFQEMLQTAEDAVIDAVVLDGVDAAFMQIKEFIPLANERVREALEGNDRKLALAAAAMVYRVVPRSTEETMNVEGVLASLTERPSAGD